MDKYINREAFIEWLKRIPLTDLSDGRGLCRVIMEDNFKKAIQKMPEGIVVDVEPVRHAKVIDKISDDHETIKPWDYRYYCSACKIPMRDSWNKYCPNCGAKMDGGDNSATD